MEKSEPFEEIDRKETKARISRTSETLTINFSGLFQRIFCTGHVRWFNKKEALKIIVRREMLSMVLESERSIGISCQLDNCCTRRGLLWEKLEGLWTRKVSDFQNGIMMGRRLALVKFLHIHQENKEVQNQLDINFHKISNPHVKPIQPIIPRDAIILTSTPKKKHENST
ncbi:hypothetical protein CRE_21620 [Caenorhabditis remanei]|uniref:Uncharacterized protein n=1 Tax=Caenorhabditis remanei TaxID=31234 RepID=E3NND3_CAERE|nr:hypothetical protein CRE_21620 [Caenorhabditis remanei]